MKKLSYNHALRWRSIGGPTVLQVSKLMSVLDKTGFVFFGFSENLDSASQSDLEQVASVLGSKSS